MTVARHRVLLLLVAVVAVLLRDGSTPHQHGGAEPGFYNYDHDLSTLAARAGGVIPARPEPVPALIALGPIARPAVAVRAAAPRRHADPRAPPHPSSPRNA